MSDEMTPTDYAQGRLAGRTYASSGFTIERTSSSDYEQPARFIHRVFDPEGETLLEAEAERWVIKGLYATERG